MPERSDPAQEEPRSSPTKSHIRGSNLLFLGRLIGLSINFGVQVLTVRYLTKSEYGAFAYALAILSMLASVLLLGLNRVVSRNAPLHEERREIGAMFGLLILASCIVSIGGLVLLGLVLGQGEIVDSLVSDPLAASLLVLMVALAPLQALDNLFQVMLAAFAHPRAVFFRRYILGPGLKLFAVLAVILAGASVQSLGSAYVLAGAVGVLVYLPLLWKAFRRRDLLQRFAWRELRWPWRDLAALGLPLFVTDLAAILRPTLAVILLEAYGAATDVADYRVFVPVAGLALIAFQSMKLLFTPAASRLLAQEDHANLDELFWRTSAWIAVLSFPVVATCVGLSESVATLLFGSEYAAASSILAVLAIGNYINAACGLNAHSVQVYGLVRWLGSITTLSTALGLVLAWLWIPTLGAFGAALATSASLIVQNIATHALLAAKTPIHTFGQGRTQVFVQSGLLLGALALVDRWLVPHWTVQVVLIAASALVFLRLQRRALDVTTFFPEIQRFPWLCKWLGGTR